MSKNTKVFKKLRKLAKSLDKQRNKLLPLVSEFMWTLDKMAEVSKKIKGDKDLKEYLVSTYKHDLGQDCYEFLEDLEYGLNASDLIDDALSESEEEPIITIIEG